MDYLQKNLEKLREDNVRESGIETKEYILNCL